MRFTSVPGKVLRSLLVPGVPICGVSLISQVESENGQICKPSELPIYVETPCKCPECNCSDIADSTEPIGYLQEGFRSIRLGLSDIYDKFQSQKVMLESKVHENKETVSSAVTFLREPKNEIHRYGAIGLGGLSGYILGLRGGRFRRFLLFNIGALGMYSICYPKQAEHYAREGAVNFRHAAKVGYNFAYGVKPGDEPVQLPSLPSLPTSFSEIVGAAEDLAETVKNIIMPAKKIDESSEEKKRQD